MISNVDIMLNMLNHPFGHGLYQLFMVKFGMVYGIVLPCFTHINRFQSISQV